MDTWVWVVIAIVVVVALVGLVLWTQRRSDHRMHERIEQAQDLRARGQEADLHAKEQAAEAAREQAEAQRARVEAERLERASRQRAAEAEQAQQAARSHLDEANRLMPEGAELDGDVDPGRRVADPVDEGYPRHDTVHDSEVSDPGLTDDRRL